MANYAQINKEALEILTGEQAKSIARMCTDKTQALTIQKGGFDLPDGYVTFLRVYDPRFGGSIYGGISPEGDVST